jgi:hypothetical protein
MTNANEIAEKLETFASIDYALVSDDKRVVWGYMTDTDSLLYGREMQELQGITESVCVSHGEHFTMLMCYVEDN